jgi:hypothetical protein
MHARHLEAVPTNWIACSATTMVCSCCMRSFVSCSNKPSPEAGFKSADRSMTPTVAGDGVARSAPSIRTSTMKRISCPGAVRGDQSSHLQPSQAAPGFSHSRRSLFVQSRSYFVLRHPLCAPSSVPMLPPAPGLFSTNTDWPSSGARRADSQWACASLALPRAVQRHRSRSRLTPGWNRATVLDAPASRACIRHRDAPSKLQRGSDHALLGRSRRRGKCICDQ